MKSPTGRRPSAGPNVQTIPIRTPEGRAIREAFTTQFPIVHCAGLRGARAVDRQELSMVMVTPQKWDDAIYYLRHHIARPTLTKRDITKLSEAFRGPFASTMTEQD